MIDIFNPKFANPRENWSYSELMSFHDFTGILGQKLEKKNTWLEWEEIYGIGRRFDDAIN